ncbi:MAG: polyphosphate kinase 1 [Gemmatimonadetes bacterium]|nr:polyphosphate kinase 1 [Gemmatimonadota bacterium]
MASRQRISIFNRELSWLAFNARVLHEAADTRTPLLERLKFLSIVSTNLDEFYMVRVAGVRRQVAAGFGKVGRDGVSPAELLDRIDERVREMVAEQARILEEEVLPELAQHGVRLLSMADLDASERLAVDAFFDSQVFPVLTPLAVDPGHPFPYISNLSLSLAVELREPETGIEHFARVKVPKSLPRWVPVRSLQYLPLEDLIGAHLGLLFPGMEITGYHAFRITRFSDLEIAPTEEPEDLLAMIEEQVFQRRFGEVVRLEVQRGMPAQLRALLLSELRETEDPEMAPLTEREVHEPGRLLDLGDLMALSTLDLPELRDPPFVPVTPPELRDGRSVFDVLRERDVLVHHPFDSFPATVERFLDEAARDEHVLAIKLTLYRTSGDTAVVRALTEAAQAGKQVAVLVELQARFDESNNITWARTLESFGVHVAYGLPGMKTHAKLALVVRREPDGIRRYVHIGTGNYNSKTARTYTDFGLLSASEALGADVSELFNMLTGFSRQREYRALLVAPVSLRERLIGLIDREAANAREGKPARIVAKMNALVDGQVIDALCEASSAGVEMDLLVRGICCLRPGVPGESERIRAVSVVGRFLEHSRLWRFENGGDPEYYLGSADWMPRNLDRRVEAMVPILDRALHPRLEAVLNVFLADNRQAWDLHADGTWVQRRAGDDAEHASHQRLLRESWGMTRTSGPGREVPVVVTAD